MCTVGKDNDDDVIFQGKRGKDGPAGTYGTKGIKGSSGFPGPNGGNGRKGLPGDLGFDGRQGPQGPPVSTWTSENRAVIDIHFFSIRSLTFLFSIPIISIGF